MKTVGFRSIVLYLLLAAFLGGIGFLVVSLFLQGDKWAMQPYNGHIYAGDSTVTLGEIRDRDGGVLASTVDGSRYYSDSETTRLALLHTVGDTEGYISTSIQYTMRAKLAGYNIITGLNDTPLNQLGNDINLTIHRGASVAAYEALNGHNGAVLLYNYETGEVLCKVSATTYDPADVPEDLEENAAYKGAYLDNTLSSSFTPGSIFKLVTAAAAMEKWPDSWLDRTYDCVGSVEIGGDSITCLHGDVHGTQNVYEAMGNSCNVYFAHLANDLGAEALQRKGEEMGFNREFQFGSVAISKSELQLSGANANQLGWVGVGQYTILANPYHMMALMGAIAKEGEFVQPKLTNNTGFFNGFSQASSRKLVTGEEARALKSLLRNYVESYYVEWMFPESMNVCAKTGTGEVGEGKDPNCWMVGFCDSSRYPYAFAVMVEEGNGGIESAGTVVSAMLGALA